MLIFCLFRNDNGVWDVTLKSSDGVEMHAHKCVLASQSEYFEKMFTGGFLETTQDVIQIYDIRGRTLKNIIDFMYTGLLVSIGEHNVEVMIFLSNSTQYYIVYSLICRKCLMLYTFFFKGNFERS